MSTASDSPTDLKDKGNAAFASKQFAEAESLYSQAIDILGEEAPHTLFGNRAAARLSLGRPQEALQDAEIAIKKDGSWLKGYHRKACAHQAMGERVVALETYRHALEIEPKNKWLQEQVLLAKGEIVTNSKIDPITSLYEWINVFESMCDSRERLSTLAHLWNQCQPPDRRQIFGQFLSLIAGAGGSKHTGVQPEDFTEEMMVPLPMDNYEDLKPVDTWMAFFGGLSREEKVQGFKLMWDATEEREKNVIVNDLRHFFLEPLVNAGQSGDDDDDDDDDDTDDLGNDKEEAVGGAVDEVTEVGGGGNGQPAMPSAVAGTKTSTGGPTGSVPGT